MERSLNITTRQDITQEEYKGPSAFVTAMGQGFFDHLKGAFFGLVISLPIAYFAHKSTKELLEAIRGSAQKLSAYCAPQDAKWFEFPIPRLKRWCGDTVYGLFGEGKGSIAHVTEIDPKHREWFEHVKMDKEHGFTHIFLSHSVGILPIVGKPFKRVLNSASERCADAFTISGIAALAGYIGGWVKAGINGGANAHAGRTQFEAAKDEIRDQRALNEALREKYIKTKLELEDLKTTRAVKEGTLHITKDNPAPKAHTGDVPTDLTPPPDAVKARTHDHRDHATPNFANRVGHAHHAEHADAQLDGWKEKMAAQKSHALEHESERA